MHPRSRSTLIGGLAIVAALALAPRAAANAASVEVPAPPLRYGLVPRPLVTSAAAIQIAQQVPAVSREIARHPGSHPQVRLMIDHGVVAWEVGGFDHHGAQFADVFVNGTSGRVMEAWTGPQLSWPDARGDPGGFGRVASPFYVWLLLCLLFVAPFFDWRRPLRLLHLDLAMLLAFSVSLAFYNHAHIYASTPLFYPPLLYVLGRMLWIGLRRGARAGPLHLAFGIRWLAAGLVLLACLRIALSVEQPHVIDIGYSSLLGARAIAVGKPLYGHFPTADIHGDTYGPVAYEAYIPFERAIGFSGRWDSLPAAHVAAIFFDLLCMLLLFLIGRRVRGPTLGVALAYAWAACPFTLFALLANSNDALLATLLLAVVLAAASPPARGVLVALAGLAKLAPLALVPLLATHGLRAERRPRRALALFALAFAAASLLAMAPVLIHSSLGAMYNRTFQFQEQRGSPFSIWGLWWGDWDVHRFIWAQTVVQVAAVGLALALAVIPRREDVIGLAAAMAAVIVAIELGLNYWSYLYIPWFAGLALLAFIGRFEAPERRRSAAATDSIRTTIAIALAIGGFGVCWMLIRHGFYAHSVLLDTYEFQRYGDAMFHGQLPYGDFSLEYPPGALPMFLLPSLVAGAGNFHSYQSTFEILMASCGALTAGIVTFVLTRLRAIGTARLGVSVALVALSPLMLGSMARGHYDFWPALLTVGAVAALVAERPKLGFALLGLGAATKGYPAVLVPLAAIFVWRSQGRRAAMVCAGVFAAVAVAVFLPFFVLAPHGVWHSVTAQTSRPLEIESLGASLMLAAHQLWGAQLTADISHGSFNLGGGTAGLFASVESALTVVALIAVWLSFTRGPASAERLLRTSAAAVCAFVIFDRVLSPQYLIWLVPLVALVLGRRGVAAAVLIAAAMVLTALWLDRTHFFALALNFDARDSWLELARNLVLVVLLGVLAWPDTTRRRTGAGAPWRSNSASTAAGATSASAGSPARR